MLGQFAFSNFKSFKKEAFLDFMAESIKDNEQSVIVDSMDGERFLPVVVMYGPNGGGKSTVLEALGYLRLFLIQTIVVSKMNEEDIGVDSVRRFASAGFKDKYHKFDPKCEKIPICFDILFRLQGVQYKYELSILHNEIIKENLYMQIVGTKDVKIVFERSEEECVLGEELEGISVDKVKKTMPLLAHIAMNYDIDATDRAVKWFLSMHIIDFNKPKKETKIILPKTKEKQEQLFKMMQEMDIPIVGFRVEKDMDGNIVDLYTKHRIDDGRTSEIPFEEESAGTRKLFGCLAEIIECLDRGTLVLADELDAKLHPKLLRYIIELFTNPGINRHGAQLLLTSHDMTTMVPDVYRRDEIWFCARNSENASKLYSLISFKKEKGQPPRNDEVYGKQYLEGRYGADPYIRRILDWEDTYEFETAKGERTEKEPAETGTENGEKA